MGRWVRWAVLVVGLSACVTFAARSSETEQVLTAELLSHADANRDGRVTYQELKALLPFLSEQAFHHMDVNGDHVLSAADLPGGATEVLARLRHLLDVGDKNHDGRIGYLEARAVYPNITEIEWKQLDLNHDGIVSAADLPQAPPEDPAALLRRLLELADANHDGVVTFQEARETFAFVTESMFIYLDRNDDHVLTRDDMPPPPPTDPIRRLLALLHEADANHDGAVTFEELSALLPELTDEMFRRLDKNEDGVITLDDLSDSCVPIKEILEALAQADANHDGAVTYAELKAVLPQITEAQFHALDRNHDHVLTREDFPAPPPEHPYVRLMRLLMEADANDDHMVTLAELQALIPTFTQYAFDYLDRNDDGVLTRDDLPKGPPPGPREMLLHLLRAADADENGAVTFDELQALAPELTEEQFNRLDQNGDSVISRYDLPPFPQDAIEQLVRLLHDADTDNDGEVTREELEAVYPELTDEQFARLDRNGDGVISAADRPEPPRDPVRHMIRLLKEADADENGIVTFAELALVFPELTQELFDRLDRNDDGVITRGDLPETPEDVRDRLRRILREADTDGDGKVSFDDVHAALPNLSRDTFEALDRNDDGFLSLADMPDGPIPPDNAGRIELLRALIRADLNGDGQLTFDEIAEVFPNAPAELLARIDTNDDWVITRAELRAALAHALEGRPLIAPTDVDADAATNALDVQLVVNHALKIYGGMVMADVDGDGSANAVDVQRVVNGALGIN